MASKNIPLETEAGLGKYFPKHVEIRRLKANLRGEMFSDNIFTFTDVYLIDTRGNGLFTFPPPK